MCMLLPQSILMNTISRREEETLKKASKARALKECDPFVKQFAECAQGRTISVVWACKSKYREVQGCVYKFTNPEAMDVVRTEYLRLRNQQWETQRDLEQGAERHTPAE